MPAQSGFLLQGPPGGGGNFEMVTTSPFGGLAYTWRNNSLAGLPWAAPLFFGSGPVAAASLVRNLFGAQGQLELVARVGDELVHYWRSAQPPYAFLGPFPIAHGVTGNPALIRSTFGGLGNFELVVPLASGGLAHFGRHNDVGGPIDNLAELPWTGPAIFGTSLGVVDAVTLIQSTFGEPAEPGHLELLARVGDQLVSFWRESTPPFTWHGPFPVPLLGLPSGVHPVGTPTMLQGNFGNVGDFEVVTPLSGGGLAHLSRNNNVVGLGWRPVTLFGPAEPVSAVSLIQSTFGSPGLGSLELVMRIGERVDHWWREDQPPFAWHGSTGTIYHEPVGDPAQEGVWQIPFSAASVGIHAALLHTGKVLFWSYEAEDPHHSHGGPDHDHDDHDHGHPPDDRLLHSEVSVFDPLTGSETKPKPGQNLFCAGQTIMADGRVLVAGGSINGLQSLHAFTPQGDGGTWQHLGLMAGGDRWYPTCTALPDGQVLITTGSKDGGGPTISAYTCQLEKAVNATYELYNPVTGQKSLFPATFFEGPNLYNLYPFVYVLPTGKVLIHFHNRTYFLDPVSHQLDDLMLETVSPHARTYPAQGTSVLLPLLSTSRPRYQARAMVFGGAGVSCPIPSSAETPADASCEILDLSQADPHWSLAAPMLEPRVMPDSVLLPDGTVLVMNGSSTGVADNGLHPVFATDLYSPETNSWAPMRPMRVQRLYHSIALLLPDGRVMSAGKDKDNNPLPFKWSEFRVEIFSPPYLFRGPRPVISDVPTAVGYGELIKINVDNGRVIDRAALIRPGAVTHSFNHNQRYVGLTVSSRAKGSVRLRMPPNANIAPPGYYMLFVLNESGVPSVASFVKLG